jgi:hypothetical protein
MPTTARKIDLAAAATRLSTTRLGVQERRRFRRAPLIVSGRMLGATGAEHDCRSSRRRRPPLVSA